MKQTTTTPKQKTQNNQTLAKFKENGGKLMVDWNSNLENYCYFSFGNDFPKKSKFIFQCIDQYHLMAYGLKTRNYFSFLFIFFI